jgi:hypothetical protein
MNGKPHKYRIKIFELCEAKSGYVCNLESYAGAHATELDHNSSFSVVDRLCEPIKIRATQFMWTDGSLVPHFLTICRL